jgi:hypothetical protein
MHRFSQEHAAERLGDFMETSGATVSRLEALTEPPKSLKRRRLAWALCVSYGVDPGFLDLTDEDRPPLVVVTAIFGQEWDDLGELLPDEPPPVIHARQSFVQWRLFDLAPWPKRRPDHPRAHAA